MTYLSNWTVVSAIRILTTNPHITHPNPTAIYIYTQLVRHFDKTTRSCLGRMDGRLWGSVGQEGQGQGESDRNL